MRVSHIAIFGGTLALLIGGAAAVALRAPIIPAFPDGLVVFPDRDFCTIEGFQGEGVGVDHESFIGKFARVEVFRPVIGAANDWTVVGRADGEIAEDPAVAFEINHPGGYCWGNQLVQDRVPVIMVTPNIKPGDRVQLSIFGIRGNPPMTPTVVADTVVIDGQCQQVSTTTSAVYKSVDPADLMPMYTVEVYGRLNLGAVPFENLEQRIVAPDIRAYIQKRDVRALPQAGNVLPPVDNFYQSMLVASPDGTQFTATYVFKDSTFIAAGLDPTFAEKSAAILAKGAGARLLSWHAVDSVGNRLGITITELGELGGPGFGGCPPGPAELSPPTGAFVLASEKALGEKLTEVALAWGAAVNAPDGVPVDGYSVSLLFGQASADRDVVAKRIATSFTTTTTIKVPDALASLPYEIDVRACAGPVLGKPYKYTTPTPSGATSSSCEPPTAYKPDNTPCYGSCSTDHIVLKPPPGDTNPMIFYTIATGASAKDCPPAKAVDMPSAEALFYDAPIAVTQPTRIRAAVWVNGKQSSEITIDAMPPVKASPPQPLLVVTAGPASITLKWTLDVTPLCAGCTSVPTSWTIYQATAPVPATAVAGTFSTTATEVTSRGPHTLLNMLPNVEYAFYVVAKAGTTEGPASAIQRATPSRANDVIGITKAIWKAPQLRVDGVIDRFVAGGAISIFNVASAATPDVGRTYLCTSGVAGIPPCSNFGAITSVTVSGVTTATFSMRWNPTTVPASGRLFVAGIDTLPNAATGYKGTVGPFL